MQFKTIFASSNALYGVVGSLFVGLCIVAWLYKGALQENALLKANLELEKANTQNLKLSLEKQNQALKQLQVKATQKDTTKIDRIVVKDSSCQAQLEGYKQLFKELGK